MDKLFYILWSMIFVSVSCSDRSNERGLVSHLTDREAYLLCVEFVTYHDDPERFEVWRPTPTGSMRPVIDDNHQFIIDTQGFEGLKPGMAVVYAPRPDILLVHETSKYIKGLGWTTRSRLTYGVDKNVYVNEQNYKGTVVGAFYAER